MADVLEVARRSNLPVRDLTKLSASVSGRGSPEPAAMWRELYTSLLKGDAAFARSVVHGGYSAGLPIELLADEVIGPAMHRIGRDWEKGAIDIMHEHRASHICANALVELKQVLDRSLKRDRPVAVGAAPEGDLTVLPTLLSQMVLLDLGWDAVNLGPNTPLKSLSRAVNELRPRLVWLSVSHGLERKTFARDCRALYRVCEAASAALVIGGRAVVEPVRASLQYTAYGDGMRHLAAFARTLNPRPQRPRRGRPPKA
jgi:methanogenic corrinoid protein MtbC1